MENGLPQNTVQALAETQDGFVWLGTEAGLVRFDGVEFQTYDRNSAPALPGSDIRCLLAAPDGALWIGTNTGLARWKDGAFRVFTTNDGLPGNGILALGEDPDGEFRVWTEQGPARMAGDRFAPLTNAGAFPPAALPSPAEFPGLKLSLSIWPRAGSFRAAVFRRLLPIAKARSGLARMRGWCAG